MCECMCAKQRATRVPTLGLLILAAVSVGQAQTQPAYTQPYSLSQESKAMFAELGRDAIRPSHLSGGQLLKGELRPVKVSETETAQRLHLETDLWQLEVEKSAWRLRLINKKTGARWSWRRRNPTLLFGGTLPIGTQPILPHEHLPGFAGCERMVTGGSSRGPYPVRPKMPTLNLRLLREI